MDVIILLIIASLLVALLFLAAFMWAVRTGQYDDSYTPSVRMLFDNEVRDKKNNNKSTNLKNEARDVLLRQ